MNEKPDISLRLTAAMRAADSRFETVGGSTRHFVNDCLLPALEAARLQVVDVLIPIHLESAERDVKSLGIKIDDAGRAIADMREACERVTELLNDPGVGDLEQWKRDCREWTAKARAAIAKAGGK